MRESRYSWMARFSRQASGDARLRTWLRRVHRWLGVVLVVFVLMLSVSGVALNHASDWGLDRRYLAWSWLLDAYGIEAPAPAASFADGGYRATLLGGRLFFGDREIARDVAGLAGIATLDPLVLVAADRTAFVLTTDGQFVQAIDTAAELPGQIERVGRHGNLAVIESGGKLFQSDPDITQFRPWSGGSGEDLYWSDATPPAAEHLQAIETRYRGRGLTVERVLADLHSGRIFATAGTLFMDLVAVCMIALSLSGFVLWIRHNRRENELRRRNGR